MNQFLSQLHQQMAISEVAAAVPSGGRSKDDPGKTPPLGQRRLPQRPRCLQQASLVIIFGGLCWLTTVNLGRAQTDADVPPAQPMSTMTLHLGKATIRAEVAATPDQRERGLMFRSMLGDNDGMIFLMPGIAPATFWMKNTLIPLSVAFFDRDGTLLEIHDMKALDETITRSESNQIAYALEMNLHWFALNGVKPGDKLDPAPSKWGQPGANK